MLLEWTLKIIRAKFGYLMQISTSGCRCESRNQKCRMFRWTSPMGYNKTIPSTGAPTKGATPPGWPPTKKPSFSNGSPTPREKTYLFRKLDIIFAARSRFLDSFRCRVLNWGKNWSRKDMTLIFFSSESWDVAFFNSDVRWTLGRLFYFEILNFYGF